MKKRVQDLKYVKFCNGNIPFIVLGVPTRCLIFQLVPWLHVSLSILQCGNNETEYQYYVFSKGPFCHVRSLHIILRYFRFKIAK